MVEGQARLQACLGLAAATPYQGVLDQVQKRQGGGREGASSLLRRLFSEFRRHL